MATVTDRLETVYSVTDRGTRTLERIEKSIRGIGAATAAIGAAAGIGGLAKSIFEATSAMSSYQARLITVLGSQEKVNAAMKQLETFETATPFNLSEVIDGYIRLLNYGLNPTMNTLKTIGDFAAANRRTLTDTVEAVSDAMRGEFERIREFGLTQDMIDRFAVNARNAQGKIQDFTGWTEGIFKAMAARSEGAMENLQNSVAGKMSNLQSRLEKISVGIGKGFEKPFYNLLIVADRILERVFGKNLDDAAKRIARLFSVENMKSWAKTFMLVVERIRDAFLSIPDVITIISVKIQQMFLNVEDFLARIGNAFDAFASGNLRGVGPALRGEQGNAIDAMTRLAQRAILADQGQQAGNRIKERAGKRGGYGSIIDQLFAGLNDNPLQNKGGPGAFFGALGSGAGGSMSDRLTEAILGGGELARVGLKETQLGGGLMGTKNNSININLSGAEGHFKNAMREVAKEVITEGIKSGRLAMVGG
jgi:hypothetical protein